MFLSCMFFLCKYLITLDSAIIAASFILDVASLKDLKDYKQIET